MAQHELKYQTHIIKSYKERGGMAERWNNEWVKGPPDLICSIEGWGLHLIEVKHMPTLTKTVKNPMTPKQLEYATKYIQSKGQVYLGIVRNTGAAKRDDRDLATDSELALFNPLSTMIQPSRATWVPYTAKLGFDMRRALRAREVHPYGIGKP